ncbi:hypothetical protein WJ05_04635 [Burkholderia vietnamiensis]|nr:hypothetical protein WJ05_04635 [Burkholderia vietnamiensis]
MLVVFVDVSAGPEWLSPGRWLAALSGHDALARERIDLRMLRLLCALLAMQSVVRNTDASAKVLARCRACVRAACWINIG